MPKDWTELSDDDLLNFGGPQTADIARYERIMRKKTNDALMDVRLGLHDLKKTIHQSTEKLAAAEKEAAQSQSKLQKAALWLTLVIAAATVIYTYTTWKSVQAMNEANEIQQEILKLQKAMLGTTSSNQSRKSGTPQSGAP